jgi:D-alanyl-D-alanine carboxypeptidase (penicillin-binding protein 5/6)
MGWGGPAGLVGVSATVALAVVVLAGGYAAFALLRAVPSPIAAPGLSHVPRVLPGGEAARLAWPPQGQAAIALPGRGMVGVHGATRPTPIASVAKVMTAYVVLRDHPLRAGDQGPPITVTPADVAAYRADAAAGQSAVPVVPGERISERQALEGLLVPSGNNMATLLARWDAGSRAAFVARMNAMARRLHLARTHYADASGVSPGSVSTAPAQVQLALQAMRIGTFRAIVAMPHATLPVAGRQFNVDALVGRHGIVGIKTGTTQQAGGCFVFAAHLRVHGHTVSVIGAVLHQLPTRGTPSIISAAFGATTTLLASAGHNLRTATVIRRGATVGTVTAPWLGRPVALEAARAVRVTGWSGTRVRAGLHLPARLPDTLHAGQRVGTAIVHAGAQRVAVPVVAAAALRGPSAGWRLRHP